MAKINSTKNNKGELKSSLHPRNRNKERYDLQALIEAEPDLLQFLQPNKNGEDSIDFSHPTAVRLLNKALLKHYYLIDYWEFPEKNLTPPIPGRADYIHRMADLLSEKNYGNVPIGNKITCFDIGVGASCIYPIIGITEYDWNFIGSDSDPKSIESAQNIIENNELLHHKIELELQTNPKDVIFGVISKDEKIDITICNPPFHATAEEAEKGTQRKVKNLTGKREKETILNFAGTTSELVYQGGEKKFIQNLVRESEKFAKNCFWYSTLVSKQANLKAIYSSLEKVKAKQVRTIPMGTGNKSTRIVAWTFLNNDEQKGWVKNRWQTLKA